MPAVTIEVPPPPPMPTMPAMSSRRVTKTGEGLGHVADGGAAIVGAESTASHRRDDMPRQSLHAISTAHFGALIPTSTTSGVPPAAVDALGEIGELLALGVRRADDVDALHRLPDECGDRFSRCFS